MTTAGAIALGLMLGTLGAQRTSLRARTLCALAVAIASIAATAGAVAGVTAAATVAAVAPLSYLLRRFFDGRHLVTDRA